MLRIDKIMRDKGISTYELATKMNVSSQYVSEVVNERKNITISGLAKFAEALNVPLASLVDGYRENGQLDSTSFNCPYCGNVLNIEKNK